MKLFVDPILHAVVGTVIVAVAAVNNVVIVVGAAATAEIVDITTSNPVIVDLSQDFEKSNSYNDSPGMDMVNVLATAESNTQIVTVIQHGKIVGEYVRDDATVTPNQLHPVYSLTKAVAGMLFGILVDQYDTSINTTLGEFFPIETDWNLVDESNVDYMKSLSAYEILTMTTGLGTDPCWAAFNCTGAWGGNDLQSTLAWPLKTGERGVFEYTPHWEIVSYIIKEVTDLSPRELLATEILPFLGINDSDIDWPLSTPLLRLEGETFENEPTAWGLELTTTQMAKIGQLFIQKGLAAPEGEGGTQVLPSEWIETSLTPEIPIPDDQLMNRELPGFTYGYRQWMVGDKEETESDKFGISYIAEGLGGQQIVLHPQSGIVLAIQSDDPFDPTTVPSSNLMWFTPLLNEGPDFFVSTTTTANSSSTTAYGTTTTTTTTTTATTTIEYGTGNGNGNCPTGLGLTAEDLAIDSDIDLTGKTALVTGGRSGLGFDIAKSLLGRGAKVIIASRSLSRNALAVRELTEYFSTDGDGVDVSFMTFDLESFESVRDFVTEFTDNNDRLDYLFLNAANLNPGIKWIDDGFEREPTPLTIDGYEIVFQTVYTAQVLMVELFLPLLRKSEPSRIIMTASSSHQLSCGALGLTPENFNCWGDGSALALLPFDDSNISLSTNKNSGCFIGTYTVGKYLMTQLAIEINNREAEAGNEVTAYSWAPGNILTTINPEAVANTTTDGLPNGSLECPIIIPYMGPEEFYISPAHGAKAAIYQALIAPEEDGGTFAATYWECEPSKGYYSQGITPEVRTEIYEQSKLWAGITDDDDGNDSDSDDEEDEIGEEEVDTADNEEDEIDEEEVDTGDNNEDEADEGTVDDGDNDNTNDEEEDGIGDNDEGEVSEEEVDISDNYEDEDEVDTGDNNEEDASEEEIDEECVSIVDLACGSDDFETLCSLVSKFDKLASSLSSGTWTVFAPNDEAFASLVGDGDGDDSLDVDGISDNKLRKLLLFHAVEGTEFYAGDLSCQSNSNLIEMSNGKDVRVKCKNGTPFGIKGGGNEAVSEFVEVDIKACNGVIHEVDRVLLY